MAQLRGLNKLVLRSSHKVFTHTPASAIHSTSMVLKSNYLIDTPEYSFLKDIGLERNNPGVYNGSWKGSGATVTSRDPGSGKPIATVQMGSIEEMNETIRVGVEAYKEWCQVPAPARGEIVRQIGDELRKYKEPLGKLVSLEVGKIYSEGQGEVQEFIDICDYAVGLSRIYAGQMINSERVQHTILEAWRPLGLVGVISAYNFPNAVFGWNAAIALLSHKQYSQMSEALAERLLDLHCRLLLLYIVQDADSLHWEDSQPFFESERGSYTIQMWWHYIRGTKDDLWNSVPPKMAQRIFAGMLNETLSVLTVRYSQIVTSYARAQLHLADICNLLFCVAELLPHVCESGEAYVGLQLTHQSVIIRDIHAKCRELFYCLLLRGASLGVISKVFRKGIENMEMFSSRQGLPSAWIMFALPKFFPKEHSCQWVTEFIDLNTNTAISLELRVLLAFPEADWSFLVKVLLMRDAHLAGIIIKHLLIYLPSSENFKNVAKHSFVEDASEPPKCEAFLCRGECFNVSDLIANDTDPVGQSNYQIVLSLTYIVVSIGKAVDIKSCLVKTLDEVGSQGWSDCLDKRQIWNQKRPPWFEAMVHFTYPVLDCIVEMLVNAVEGGASMYQAMSLALTCVSEMWECIPEGLYKISSLLQDVIPVATRPLSDSVLMQVVFAGLYTELVKAADSYEKEKDSKKVAICLSISEAICSIDEDDKHTDQIDLFLKQVQDGIILDSDYLSDGIGRGAGGLSAVSTVKIDDLGTADSDRISHSPPANYAMELDVGIADYIAEVLASDILTSKIGKQALKVCYSYLKNNKEWLLERLGTSDNEPSEFQGVQGQNIKETKQSILKSMFFIGNTPFDQLLTCSLKIDFTTWLQTSLSLNPERAWLHLSRRCDFQEDAKLTMPEVAMVAGITKVMKKRKDIAK